jgi:hypothetical protein
MEKRLIMALDILQFIVYDTEQVNNDIFHRHKAVLLSMCCNPEDTTALWF